MAIVIGAVLLLMFFFILAPYPDFSFAIFETWATCSLLSFPIDLLARLPYRYRLPAEFAIMIVLLVFSACINQHETYSRHALGADRLAQLASTWATETDSPKGRMLFESEAAWFAHKARVFRSRALRYGLIRALLPGFDSLARDDDRELILDLGISQVLDWHEADILREHERLAALPQTQGPNPEINQAELRPGPD